MSPRLSTRLLAGQSDERLLELIAEGHERAFEALVLRYKRPLLRYCRRSMGLSDARSEDVLQHALLRAWLALENGTKVRECRPWLYRVVRNTAVNTLRRSPEGHAQLTDATAALAAVSGEDELERRMAVRDTISNVAALPLMQRRAITLTAFEGASHEEVASALGVSHGAARGLLYRARATLRSAAAVLTPQWAIEWACGAAGAGAPSAERLAELTAGSGAGALGLTGILLKGTLAAATAGAIAAGAVVHVVQPAHGHPQRAQLTHREDRAPATDPGLASSPRSGTGLARPEPAAYRSSPSASLRTPHSGARRSSGADLTIPPGSAGTGTRAENEPAGDRHHPTGLRPAGGDPTGDRTQVQTGRLDGSSGEAQSSQRSESGSSGDAGTNGPLAGANGSGRDGEDSPASEMTTTEPQQPVQGADSSGSSKQSDDGSAPSGAGAGTPATTQK